MTKLFELFANRNFLMVVDPLRELQLKTRIPKALIREADGLAVKHNALLLCAERKSDAEIDSFIKVDPTPERLESILNKRHLNDYFRGRQRELREDFNVFVTFSIIVRKRATELGFKSSLQFVLSSSLFSQQAEPSANDTVISFFQIPGLGHPLIAPTELESFTRERMATIIM